MKKNLKGLTLVLCTSMLLAAVPGCTKKPNTDGKIQLSVGSWPDKTGDPNGYAAREELIAEFNKKYPDIEIVPDTYAFSADTFYAKAEGETLPILYEVPYTEAEKIIKFGYASDLTDAFKEAGFYDNINDFVMDKISSDGKVYLIPNTVYTLGLAMNMDMLKQAGYVDEDETPKAPKTFDDLTEMAVKIKEATGKPGFLFPTTNNAGGWYFTALAWNFGAKFMEQTDGKWEAKFDSEECVNALQWLKDMKWKYNVMPENTLINSSDLMQTFGSGNAAMCISSPAFVSMFKNYGMEKDNIGYANMPAGPERNVTLMGGSYFALSNTASKEQIDAAFKWIEFNGTTMNLTDEIKDNIKKTYKATADDGNIVGIKDINIWSDNTPFTSYKNQIIDEFANINMNHVKLYNEKGNIEFQGEEPVCAQDLYAALDACIQEVLTNENADCKAVLQKANADFQKNSLDYEN